jgi:hypothetical protein
MGVAGTGSPSGPTVSISGAVILAPVTVFAGGPNTFVISGIGITSACGARRGRADGVGRGGRALVSGTGRR